MVPGCDGSVSTLNVPQFSNSEPGTPNPEPRTRNLNPEPGTWNPEPAGQAFSIRR